MPRSQRDRVTIGDVAARVGVSLQTVSRVLNDRTDVAPSTRARVQRAMAELGYVPSAAARVLSGAHRPTLGVLTFARFASNPYFAGVVEGAAVEATTDAMAPLIVPTDGSVDGVRVALDLFLAHDVAGVVVAVPHETYRRPFLAALRQLDVPMVTTGAFRDPARRIPAVDVDSLAAGRLAARHVLALGHRHIALLRGPVGHAGAEERARAHAEALAEAGLGPEDQVVAVADWSFEAGVTAVEQALDRGRRFTAVVCHHDQTAIGAIHALAERGLRVPGDVAVVGFGDMAVDAFIKPALTTVGAPAREIGAAAVRRVLSSDDDLPAVELLPAQLMVRQSCGIVVRSAARRIAAPA